VAAAKAGGGAGAPDVQTPAEGLLDLLGPVHRYNRDDPELGDIGRVTRASMRETTAPIARGTIGPLERVHAFWFAGMSCDGCTIAVSGAGSPSVESLLLGAHPGIPRVVLHHPVLDIDAGPNYMAPHELAVQGELDAPYVVILEGSIADERIAVSQGGYFSAVGEEPWGPDGELRSVTAEEWVARLAPGAAAVIAIGTCATWGGIPAAEGNPTGAMSLMDFLGRDYRSAFGVPVVNVPGCAPVGDNFTETVAAVLYFLQGFGPLPEFDDLGRPAWLFGETVHRRCVRGAYYEEGVFAEEFGDPECLVEIGCWGPVVNCNITSRGAINGLGGCMNSGGACIGCTMPGFPDKFTPFYKAPPGSKLSSSASRLVGSVMRPLRQFSNAHVDREVRWDLDGSVPSGWARAKQEPGPLDGLGHRLYDRLRRSDDRGRHRGGEWGKATPGEAGVDARDRRVEHEPVIRQEADPPR
jgi:hydrogenase small subunit